MPMRLERFDCENLFRRALIDGINIFCGAGFSIEAKDKVESNLPVGNALLDELKKAFPAIETYTNLPRACTKLKQTNKTAFYEFLYKRFCVGDFDPRYLELAKIKIRNIYTTNIDDLFFKIYDKSKEVCYLNDQSISGNAFDDEFAINYFPLHGCVKYQGEYVFGATDIASAFSQSGMRDSWQHLAKDASNEPILFWGWNFDDAGPIEAMYGEDSNTSKNIQKWVLLYNPTEETKDYLESLGFNIIIGDTDTMLNYLSEFLRGIVEFESDTHLLDEKKIKALSRYCPPLNDNNITTYPLSSLFLDYTPRWSHIYSNVIPKTKQYREIADCIVTGKNMIIYGIRGSGKTTLMMQLLIELKADKPKHYIIAPSLGQVKTYVKILNGSKVLLFIDDCFRDTEAILELCNQGNVQVVAFDRDFSYENQFSRLRKDRFATPIDITEVISEDAQAILNIIPHELKRLKAGTTNFEKDPTIPNLLAANLKALNFSFIKTFYAQDPEAAEVFIMICYVHSCGVPCSFDMIYSYLGDNQYTWENMLDIIQRAGGLIKESSILGYYNIDPSKQEYYECRSRFFAEKILASIPKGNKTLANVLFKFTQDVPVYKICLYDKFKRSGYDADLAERAFLNIDEGEQYYNICCKKDGSEYIYQQAAIYFSRKNDYKRAFEWIDKARNLTHYNRFSIDSTYAKIYFDVNLNVNQDLALSALGILDNCCTKDKRKAIHFLTFAKCVLRFFDKYGIELIDELLDKAVDYVQEGLQESNWALSKKNKYALQEIQGKLKRVRLRLHKI